jgi:hypothetical protein
MKKIMTWIWALVILAGVLIFSQGLGFIFGGSEEPRVDLLYLIIGALVAILGAYFSQKK